MASAFILDSVAAMNSIQFITNQVDRVIPPFKRSASTVSLTNSNSNSNSNSSNNNRNNNNNSTPYSSPDAVDASTSSLLRSVLAFLLLPYTYIFGYFQTLRDAESDEATDEFLALKPRKPGHTFKYPRYLAPPRPLLQNKPRKKKTLILDLDETLIHTLSRTTAGGHMVEVKLNPIATLYNVLKRPYCDLFLETVGQWYNLVIFTASVKEYADPMIDWLEKDRAYFSQRFYRNHCTLALEGSREYIKDISKADADLGSVILIDNSQISFKGNENNGILIESWVNDQLDSCLLDLIPLLAGLRYVTDVRSILGLKQGEEFF